MSGLEPLMIAAAVSAAGAAVQGAGTIAGGIDANNAAKYEAKQSQILAQWEQKQLETQAQRDEAAGFVRAREKRHEAKLLESSLQAKAAASGGGSSNPTVFNLLEDIAGRGEYLAQTEIAAGKMDAEAKRHRGAATVLESNMHGDILRMKGKSAKTSGLLTGIGQGIAGAGDAYSSYARYK
jgi:hypothetical protein